MVTPGLTPRERAGTIGRRKRRRGGPEEGGGVRKDLRDNLSRTGLSGGGGEPGGNRVSGPLTGPPKPCRPPPRRRARAAEEGTSGDDHRRARGGNAAIVLGVAGGALRHQCTTKRATARESHLTRPRARFRPPPTPPVCSHLSEKGVGRERT